MQQGWAQAEAMMSPDTELTRVLQSYQIAYQDKSVSASNRFKIPAFQYVQDSNAAQRQNALNNQSFQGDDIHQHMWSLVHKCNPNSAQYATTMILGLGNFPP